MKIDEAIATIRGHMPDPGPDTVDTIKAGDATRELRGIALSFMGTLPVLERAAAADANLVISHEPVWYNHLDTHDWLSGDPVYQHKSDLIERHGMVVWRLHDAMHKGWPDDIADGVIASLDWGEYVDPARHQIVRLPAQPLSAVVDYCATRMGCADVRVAGDPAMTVRTVALIPGAAGGATQIKALQQSDVDLVVCGESAEWETCEYVRDARASGLQKALIVLGHAASEEAGMRSFAQKVEAWMPGVPVRHLPAGAPLWCHHTK